MHNPFKVIKVVGDPILTKHIMPVADVTDDIRHILKDMLQIMYDQEGCGLAANQIGIDKRLVTIDLADGPKDSNNPRYYINPQIIWCSESKDWFDEGCLSIPGARMPIERPTEIKLTYLDYDGNSKTEHIKGFLARALQHEVDHLNGILAIDHLSQVDRENALDQVAALRKQCDAQGATAPDLAPSL